MRTSKKIVSLILAVMMVVSMMSVMAVTVANASAFSSDKKAVFVTDAQNWDSDGVLYAYYWKVETTGYDEHWNPTTETTAGDWVATTYLYDNGSGQSVYGVAIPDDANWVLFNRGDSRQTTDTTNVYNGSWWYIDNNKVCQPCSGSVFDTCDQTESLSATFVDATGADRYFVLDGHYYYLDANGALQAYANTAALQVAEVVGGTNNGQTFTSVNDAVASAGEDGEVKLIADIKSNVGIDGDYTTTLDLNGHTIRNTSGSGITLYTSSNGKTFTIKDTSTDQTGGISINKRYAGDGCISDSSGRKVVIEGGTYTSDANALYVSSDDGWTINGGTFNGNLLVKSDVDITNGTVNGNIVQSTKTDYSSYPYVDVPADIEISGGSINGNIVENAANNGNIAVSGGTFDSAVPEEFCAEGYIPTDDGNGNYGVKVGSYVCQIDSTKYETLATAISAAQNGDTVKLLKSVTGVFTISGKTLTLDLNGFNITSTSASQPIQANSGTKLTIVNSNTDKSENTSTQNAVMGPANGNNYGSLIARGDDTTVDIYAGYYYGYNGNKTAIHALNGATITFYDCTVNGAQGIDDTTAGKEGKVFYSGLSNPTQPYASSPGTIVVHGGTFNGRMSDSNWGNYIIDGGTFDRNVVVLNENPVDEQGHRVATASGSMTSKGNGTLEEAGWLANEFEVVENGDGTYGVAPAAPFASDAEIEGYQLKAVRSNESSSNDGNNIETKGLRILTKVTDDDLFDADEYGYVVAKVTGKDQATAKFTNLKKDGGNGEKTINCKGSVNSGITGISTDTYVTLAVNGMSDNDQVAVRFYVVKDGKTYYANYTNVVKYSGIIATMPAEN
ncbi:MAG: hypothetical protein K6F88_05830 [Ruminococcus sp.]|nr:hypothetical protein [Ruminococcus sp.]